MGALMTRRGSSGRWYVVIVAAGLVLGYSVWRLAGLQAPRAPAPAPLRDWAADSAALRRIPIGQGEDAPTPQLPTPDVYGYALTPLEAHGRNTWYFWTAGNERFYRQVAILSDGYFDLLKIIDSRRHGQRFEVLGLLTDPGCVPATAADPYGLWLDVCAPDDLPDIPGRPSGVIGLRLFDNPKFDAAKWSLARYVQHPRNVEPPYLVGMACGFCHIGLDPIRPPADPERPRWENLSPTIGNQYLEDARLFSINMTPDDFRWHVANKQPAGTVDTSRFATDHISNPNAINTIFNLAYRPAHEERMKDGSTRAVHHILKDGADSIGIAGASLRVYVNIGMCSEYWLTLHDAIYGMSVQRPFSTAKAPQECADWGNTEARMPGAEAFLKSLKPRRLLDAVGGQQYLDADPAIQQRGKIAFAENCAACHSSKQPPTAIATESEARREWFRRSVLSDEFLEGNFLSDDKRWPVTVIGTNIARAMASNATAGHVWEEFSSESYKALPSVGELRGLYNPLDPSEPIDFTMPGGGRGYYRTPSLTSIWATAPFLHNNSVGVYTKDPTVHGRMVAYMDGMEKLLWPERRLGLQSIPVTTTPSRVRLSTGPSMEVPVNTAINVIARVDPMALPQLGQRSIDLISWLLGNRFLLNQLLAKNLAPDFIEDHGHTFGSNLPDADKRALIEFLKTF